MPITAEQIEERRKGIGSSDIAALLGLSPFTTPEELRLEKCGKLIDRPSTDVMEAGNLLEDGVLIWAEKSLGPCLRNQTKAVAGTPIVVNTDALVVSSGEPVEVKTARLFGFTEEEWGNDGSDAVPERVIVQAHAHMMAWDKPVCHVPALIGGRGFALFAVPRNPDLCVIIAEKAVEFWEKHVLADVPVIGGVARYEVLKRMKRQPNKIVGVAPSLVQEWLEATEARKQADAVEEATKAAVLAVLGDAEAGECGDKGAVTYFEQYRKEFVSKASTFRVLRYKKNGL